MPLPEPAPREKLHTRTIVIDGFLRDDGLVDIDAHLTDVKSYTFGNDDRGTIPQGEPLHGMRLRMTLDRTMLITEVTAVTEYAPYAICPQAAPNFAALAGLRIKPGFLRDANARIGGVHGCTHIREMLQQIATTAFQTMVSVTAHRRPEGVPSVDGPHVGGTHVGGPMSEALIGTCYAYADGSPVVRRTWPGRGTA